MPRRDIADKISKLLKEKNLTELLNYFEAESERVADEDFYIESDKLSETICDACGLLIENEELFYQVVNQAGFQVKQIITVKELGFKRCLIAY